MAGFSQCSVPIGNTETMSSHWASPHIGLTLCALGPVRRQRIMAGVCRGTNCPLQSQDGIVNQVLPPLVTPLVGIKPLRLGPLGDTYPNSHTQSDNNC